MGRYTGRGAAVWGALMIGSTALFGLTALGVPDRSSARGTTVMSAPQMASMASVTTAKPKVTLLLHRRVVQLTIMNFSFSPANVVVSPGTTLVWTNKDGDPHTVTGSKKIWASDALDTGDHFTRVFGKTGTFTYYCAIHPFMHGTVTVRA
jgi:plastocyanin